MPKRLRTNAIEREGVNYVRGVVERANSMFNEIHRENDYGNDAFVELVDGELVTGRMLLLQIKSGKSYCTSTGCVIPATPDQLTYWRSHRLPVIGIVYDPQLKAAFWVNITEYLQHQAMRPRDDGSAIHLPKSEINRFDDDGFRDFFLPQFIGKPIRLDKPRSVRFALSPSYAEHSIGVRSLFYGHRNDEDTWLVFERVLRERRPGEIAPAIAYLMAHVPWHGDIFGGADSALTDEVRTFARERMKSYDPQLVRALLRLVDDNGFERGSTGQSVAAILDLVEGLDSTLEAIVTDSTMEQATRENALTLYCLRRQDEAETFLSSLLLSSGPIADWARSLQEHLKAEGFFYPG